nr:uncharacterized protein LOC117274604 [Nicotiana tomentosiformis]
MQYDSDADFKLMNYRQYDRMNNSFELQSDINAAHDVLHRVADENVRGEEAALESNVQVFEEVQCVEQQVEEECFSIDRLSKVVGYDEQLSTENVGSKKGADDEVVGTEKHVSTCAFGSPIAKGNVLADADHECAGTEEHTPSYVGTPIGKGNAFAEALVICQELLHAEIQEVVTTLEVENSGASIDTTLKLSDEKLLSHNTPMLPDDVTPLNEAGVAEIDKDIGISEGNASGSVGMHIPSVSQHLDQISSDASQLLPNTKRRKASSSPNVLGDTSDIPDFNLCSFSMGSTQETSSEGNYAAVVVGEERQEHHE